MNQSIEPVYQVPQSLFKAVVEYMSNRPWKEVGGAMPQLLAIQPVTIKPVKAKEQQK